MDLTYFIFLSSGLFLGWSLGANDAANIFGTAVGTKMVKFRTAAIISSLFIIIGAVYAGSGASETLGELGSINTLPGAFVAALSAALAVYWMIGMGISVSASQAIVGAIIGWNLYSNKPTDMEILTQIVSTWIICPVLSAIIAVIIYFMIRGLLRYSHPHLLRQDSYTRIGLILAGAFGAYALGANNIANVMGIFVDSSPFHSLSLGRYLHLNGTQVLFLIGALAISTGMMTYSHKVIRTVGTSVMTMSPIIAWIVVVSQGIVLFAFSSLWLEEQFVRLGIPPLPLVPVSSSQAVIGAIIGIGLAKGGNEIHWPILGRIAVGWVFTPVISALICFFSLFFMANVFNQTVYLP